MSLPQQGSSTPTHQLWSRRQFTKFSLAALPAAVWLSSIDHLIAAGDTGAANTKPDSKVNGVQLGLNVPYSFSNAQMTGAEILKHCVQLGLSAVELRTQPVEVFLGAPPELVFPKKPAPARAAEKLAEWRKSVSIDEAVPFRNLYEKAGVLIEIVKVDGIFKMSEAELDYVFPLAKALGARAISTEISHREEDLKRVGSFADKHRLMVGYHGHASTKPEDWEKAFSLAKYNGANVDLGHFVAGNNTSPVPFIKQHHDRVTHVHLKDRKLHNGPNMPFGEGDTPIAEVLQLIRDNGWNIQGTIEFEYRVPRDSDRMTEIARCIAYCRKALKQPTRSA